MSYDLYFDFPSAVPAEELERYFSTRPNYQLGNGAAYQNQATGVYFQFAWSADPHGNHAVSKASFNLNYFRPHVFGLEAEPEVRAFINRFVPRIQDPQKDGMGSGPYSTKGFLTGWNTGNEYAYGAFFQMQMPSHKFFSLPAAELESVWRWNASIAATQAKFGESLFVPLTENGYPMRVREPRYNSAPQTVRNFIQSLTPTSEHIAGVAMDAILDSEMVRKYAK